MQASSILEKEFASFNVLIVMYMNLSNFLFQSMINIVCSICQVELNYFLTITAVTLDKFIIEMALSTCEHVLLSIKYIIQSGN